MPFDAEQVERPAIRGDVADIAIAVSLALDSVIDALKAIHAGQDPEEFIVEIQKNSDELEGYFDALTGWSSDGN